MSRRTIGIGILITLALIGALALSVTLLRPADEAAWRFIGPNSAHILAMAFDPTTPTTLYAGTEDGVYTSDDGGATWRAAGSGPFEVRAIGIDPVTPTTLYAGTETVQGMFKSEDGGVTWRAINNGLGERPFTYALAIDPANPQVIYAGTENGVYKSNNGGAAWRRVLAIAPIFALAVDPLAPATLYASGGRGGVHKSEDGGMTWRAIDDGLPAGARVLVLALHPTERGVVYAGTDNGVYASADGGVTWRAFNDGLLQPDGTAPVVFGLVVLPTGEVFTFIGDSLYWRARDSDAWRQAPFSAPVPPGMLGREGGMRLLAVLPTTPPTLFVAPDRMSAYPGLYRSTDFGATWQPAGLHAYVTHLAVTESALYAGTHNGGVYRSEDRGVTWRVASTGLTHFYVSALVVDPTVPGMMYAGTGDGVCQSVDGGVTWHAIGLRGQWVYALVFDPQRPTTLYAGASEGVFVSDDRGATWRATGLTGRVFDLVFDPSAPSTLYAAAGDDGVHRSDDGGATWRAVTAGMSGQRVLALAVAPTTPPTLYAGTGSGASGSIFRSVDGGATWNETDITSPADSVSAIAVDPTVPARVYAVASSPGVLRSIDGGLTWDIWRRYDIATALAIEPAQLAVIYVGTWRGVYRWTVDDR